MKSISALICLFLLMLSSSSIASEEQRVFSSTQQQSLYDSLILELRCLVCQNQNIADSNAELAKDLRQKTYELIQAGQTEAQIKQFMRDRYGDFVLYEPPLEKKTWLLWIGPFVLLFIILGFVTHFIRQQHRIAQQNSQQTTTGDEENL